jgi:calcineurin-like phosphoesterase family protein
VILFTADTHWGDPRWLALGKRPFASVAAMDAAMVANWNAAVRPDDTVWHLGDVARRPGEVAGLLARLHGTKHLIRGNNDPPETLAAAGWASVGDYAELEMEGTMLVLCHYPFRSWNRQAKGAWNLHGHSHGKLKPLPRQVDVGVDVWGFRPVGLGEIIAARSAPSRREDGQA